MEKCLKFSKIQQYVLDKLQDGKWQEEDDLHCTRATIKALERRGIIEHHPKSGGWTWHWRLTPKGGNSTKVS